MIASSCKLFLTPENSFDASILSILFYLSSRHETPYKFFIEPTGNNDKFLALDRLSQEIRLVANRDEIPKNATRKPIFGIIGTIQLIACKYLVVITKCSRAGIVNGQHIWRVDETQILPFSRSILHLNEEQVSYII